MAEQRAAEAPTATSERSHIRLMSITAGSERLSAPPHRVTIETDDDEESVGGEISSTSVDCTVPRSRPWTKRVSSSAPYCSRHHWASTLPALAVQHGTVGDVSDEGVDEAGDRVRIGFDVDIDAPLGSDGGGRRTDRGDDLRESVDPDGVDERIDGRTGGEDDGVRRSAARRPLSSMAAETVR